MWVTQICFLNVNMVWTVPSIYTDESLEHTHTKTISHQSCWSQAQRYFKNSEINTSASVRFHYCLLFVQTQEKPVRPESMKLQLLCFLLWNNIFRPRLWAWSKKKKKCRKLARLLTWCWRMNMYIHASCSYSESKLIQLSHLIFFNLYIQLHKYVYIYIYIFLPREECSLHAC